MLPTALILGIPWLARRAGVPPPWDYGVLVLVSLVLHGADQRRRDEARDDEE